MKSLELINMKTIYAVGDTVILKESCVTKLNRYKKGDKFTVEDVSETVVYLKNNKGGLTIHRFLNNLVEKI